MFLFLLAISDWLNFQPCNRKKERRVRIFLEEVAVVVVPQSIRRLSLQKSQPLAIETRFYLFQNCHFFFFPWEEQVWSRCQVLWWWGWWYSNLFLPLFLAWALFSVLTSWPFQEPVESPKPAENPHCQNKKEKVFCAILVPPTGSSWRKGMGTRGWGGWEWEDEGAPFGKGEPWNWLSSVVSLNSAHQTPQSDARQARYDSACVLLI